MKPKSAGAPRAGKYASAAEPLEARIAPAALINPSTLVYKDTAGDIVTVKFSKPVFTVSDSMMNLANANAVFKFDTGDVSGTTFDAGAAPAQQLQLLDLTHAPAGLPSGISISITAAHAESADVGFINATGISLGKITVGGDLGRIDAGSANTKMGVQSLTVQSVGAHATSTQQTTGASLQSQFVGTVGSLSVAGNIMGATISVVNATNGFGNLVSRGSIGTLTIGGSLEGLAAAGSASDQTGAINCVGDIGTVKIGTAPSDGIIGGSGVLSGSIQALGNIGTVKIIGTLKGGAGQESGSIIANGSIGNVSISGDLAAGTGINSGFISTQRSVGLVKIGGNIDGTVAGAGAASGGIQSSGSIAGVTVTGALKGGAAVQSGFIDAGASIGKLSLHDILGGSAQSAGTITAGGQITSLNIVGSITGGTAEDAGSVFSGMNTSQSGAIGSIKIGMALTGGSAASAGTIGAGGHIGSLTIGPAKASTQVLLAGGGGDFSGSVLSEGGIGAVTITGAIQGGGGSFSGSIVSHDLWTSTVEQAGDIGAVKISGKIAGGAGDDSGEISADGNLKSVSAGELDGANGTRSGSLRSGQGSLNPGTMGAIQIAGVLAAGAGTGSGAIIAEGAIASVSVKGAASGGSIRAGDSIGTLTFGAGISHFEVSARGQAKHGAKTDVAIGAVSVHGDVAETQFLAGYDTSLNPLNGEAQIGAVHVAGNWTASDLVAGIEDETGDGFGSATNSIIPGGNPAIVSKIASVVITGSVTGTAASGDHFGFVAHLLGPLTIGGTKISVKSPTSPVELDLVNHDVTAREI